MEGDKTAYSRIRGLDRQSSPHLLRKNFRTCRRRFSSPEIFEKTFLTFQGDAVTRAKMKTTSAGAPG